MSRCKIVTDSDGKFYGIRFNCPGCALGEDDFGFSAGAHVLPVDWLPQGYEESPHASGKPHWTFNGDFDRPVFGPSIRTTRDSDFTCHSFIGCNGAQPGQIIFLDDCTHALRGKTVELPELQDRSES